MVETIYKALYAIAKKADSVFGVSSDASKIINSLLRFNRWKLFVGGDSTTLLCSANFAKPLQSLKFPQINADSAIVEQ